MKIVDSQVAMSGKSEYQQTQQVTGSYTITINNPPAKSVPLEDKLEISDEAQNALKNTQLLDPIAIDKIKINLEPNERLRLQIFDKTIEVFSSSRIHIIVYPIQAQPRLIQTQRHEVYREYEKTSFEAQGKIKTADGKEIDFSTELTMSREFAAERFATTLQEGVALKDPLVVNFDGPAAALTDTKFKFDIDSDGEIDQLSFLKQGSGFLALDKNEDGIVNNGNELFGATSGNGFADLAQFDLDHNGWIDENDSIFEKLRIWTKDQDGKDVLFGLGQKGIGAIYLGNVNTQFTYKNDANQTQGALRQTGIFLREDGTAGTVQQIDLVV